MGKILQNKKKITTKINFDLKFKFKKLNKIPKYQNLKIRNFEICKKMTKNSKTKI